MRICQRMVLLAGTVGATFVFTMSGQARGQFALQGPGVTASDFRVTTFASGLNFPVGMAELRDGSVLVGVSQGSSFFNSSTGSLLRLIDTDQDGVADERQTLVADVPGGGLTSVRVAGDLVFTTGQGRNKPISIYRMGSDLSAPLTAVGSLSITYPSGGWLHPHSALAARPTPGRSNEVELYFQLGSRENFSNSTRTAILTSNIGVTSVLEPGSIYRVSLRDDGQTVMGEEVTRIASGLRNAAGFAFHPQSGDFYLEDNGIDGLSDPNEPHSADELNRIPAGDVGGTVENFGFPDSYVRYRTGEVVGTAGIQPLVAFQPLAGAESEGPNDIAFSPANFPESLAGGVFVTMHGRFSAGGLANEENPLVFVDLEDNSYFHVISNQEPLVGHIDGLLTTDDALFLADMSPGGGLGGSDAFSGKVYQLRRAALAGDFDNDGMYTCADIDALIGAIAGGSDEAVWDLDHNDQVDLRDRDRWLGLAGEANPELGGPYLVADANLDGVVDGADFNLWNAHKGTPGAAWCGGDFQADGWVDAADLELWTANRFRASAPAAMAVPEPGIWSLGWAVMAVANRWLRRRRR